MVHEVRTRHSGQDNHEEHHYGRINIDSGSRGKRVDIQKPDVRSIVEDIEKGKIALPDFQRDFVWKSDDVQDLLVSVLADYYIGTMLVIDDVKDEAGFKLRLVPGVPATTTISSIVKILLDGQQRCSSLYYALRAPDIPLSGRKNPSRFYLNVSSAMADDWQSTVETVHLNSKSALTKIDADPNYIAFPLLLNAAALVVKLQERGQTDQIGGVVSSVSYTHLTLPTKRIV